MEQKESILPWGCCGCDTDMMVDAVGIPCLSLYDGIPPPLSVRTHTASTATKLINSQIVLNFNSIKSGLQLWDFLSCDTKLTGCFQVPAWYTIWHLKIILGPHTGVNTYIILWITVIACVGKSHQKDTVTSHQHNNHTHSSYCEKLLWKKL